MGTFSRPVHGLGDSVVISLLDRTSEAPEEVCPVNNYLATKFRSVVVLK
jgi:hypothetical protein